MSKNTSIIYAALQRLDRLMAPGEKRFAAKQAQREAGEPIWGFSTGRIHSYATRTTYQKHILDFCNWARVTYGIRRMEELDARSSELASEYLKGITQGYSAWTLQTKRSALRLFFGNRQLAAELALPVRKREAITRSRGPAVRDDHFQPANWQPLLCFLAACGLRRAEVRDLFVRDVQVLPKGGVVVCVRKGKGGRARRVEVIPDREPAVLQVIMGRSPDEKVFASLPVHLDIHAIRRQFAQDLYEYYAGCFLPANKETLQLADLDLDALAKVSQALGHKRVRVIYDSYIR
jgi:integrase